MAAPPNSSKSALRLEQQRRAFRLLELDAELAFEVGIKDSGAIEIEAFDSDTVAHVCETMAQKVVGPKLDEALLAAPMDGEAAAEVRHLAGSLTWAVDRAEEMHAAVRRGRRDSGESPFGEVTL